MEHTEHLFPAPAGYDRLVQAIRARLTDAPVLVALDGRCGAGKTTLARRLQTELGCRVFHMDDFFLRPEQRTAERLARPGENVDHERFLAEVLACHPALWDCYDLRAFLTVDPDEQLRRIESRSGPEKAAMFRTRWIPLEEQYFAAFSISQRCDILLQSETEVPYVR